MRGQHKFTLRLRVDGRREGGASLRSKADAWCGRTRWRDKVALCTLQAGQHDCMLSGRHCTGGGLGLELAGCVVSAVAAAAAVLPDKHAGDRQTTMPLLLDHCISPHLFVPPSGSPSFTCLPGGSSAGCWQVSTPPCTPVVVRHLHVSTSSPSMPCMHVLIAPHLSAPFVTQMNRVLTIWRRQRWTLCVVVPSLVATQWRPKRCIGTTAAACLYGRSNQAAAATGAVARVGDLSGDRTSRRCGYGEVSEGMEGVCTAPHGGRALNCGM